MGSIFEFVEYGGVPYPDGYDSKIKEVAGHFDKDKIEQAECYSLHTEYSYGKRNFNSTILENYPVLRVANKGGVPQLWKNEDWANEFANFILELTTGNNPPYIIEIHPPFNDYTDLDGFINCYKVFEEKIKTIYPKTNIFIENRAGAVYRGGKFVVSKANEIVALCEKIEQNGLSLGVVLDFPQLLTAERIDTLKFDTVKYAAVIEKLHLYQHLIKGIHIWGKKKNPKGRWIAHCGTLDTYFDYNDESKNAFITGIKRICDDGKTRFFVPEVNSGAEDLKSVIEDVMV